MHLAFAEKVTKDAFRKELSVFQQNLLGSCVGTLQHLSVGQAQISKHSEGT